MKGITWVFALVLAGACSHPTPLPPAPAAPPPRDPTAVQASYGHVWDAVIDHFSRFSIPIATLDRSSGLIVTSPLGVPADKAVAYSFCGWGWVTDNSGADRPGGPRGHNVEVGASRVTYNALVRGDSTGSSVRVTAQWISEVGGTCQSKDVYEKTLEADIAKAATSGPS